MLWPSIFWGRSSALKTGAGRCQLARWRGLHVYRACAKRGMFTEKPSAQDPHTRVPTRRGEIAACLQSHMRNKSQNFVFAVYFSAWTRGSSVPILGLCKKSGLSGLILKCGTHVYTECLESTT